jgi:hypothetical protein
VRGLGEGSSRLFQPLRGSAFVSQAVTELRVAAEVLFFRPLTRAEGDSMPFILRLAEQFRNSLFSTG